MPIRFCFKSIPWSDVSFLVSCPCFKESASVSLRAKTVTEITIYGLEKKTPPDVKHIGLIANTVGKRN